MLSRFQSTDLITTSVLIYFNHTLEKINKTNPNRCEFVVKKTNSTDKILKDFHAGILKVEPKKFNFIQRELKGRIYNN